MWEVEVWLGTLCSLCPCFKSLISSLVLLGTPLLTSWTMMPHPNKMKSEMTHKRKNTSKSDHKKWGDTQKKKNTLSFISKPDPKKWGEGGEVLLALSIFSAQHLWPRDNKSKKWQEEVWNIQRGKSFLVEEEILPDWKKSFLTEEEMAKISAVYFVQSPTSTGAKKWKKSQSVQKLPGKVVAVSWKTTLSSRVLCACTKLQLGYCPNNRFQNTKIAPTPLFLALW